jgi:tRNA/tmRNA/rRNA uracil-C5-methylase (TrmA/RlmC/RlmD family)
MVRGRAGTPKIGLFQEGTHRIVDTPHCQVHHPMINQAAAALKRAIRATRTPPYADRPHVGLVRALQVVVARRSEELQLVVVVNDDAPEGTKPLFEALALELEGDLAELWWNGNPERTNTILGPHWKRVWTVDGPRVRDLGLEFGMLVGTRRRFYEFFGGARVYYPPGAFGQSHLELAGALVDAVHACVPPGARVAEFYAGSGAIGLGLVKRGHEVHFNERGDASLEGLADGILALGQAGGRATLHPGGAGEHAALVDAADVVILDPPRRGLDEALLARLRDAPPERVIYVACGLQSFLRDARTLLAGGRLALTRITPYDLFPFTEHVETLAVFDRHEPG